MRIPIGVTPQEGDGTRIYLRTLPQEIVTRFNALAHRQSVSQSELFVAIMSTALADIEHVDIKKLLELRLQFDVTGTIKILEKLGFKRGRKACNQLARALEYFSSDDFKEKKKLKR